MASEALKSLQMKFPHWANDIAKLHRLFGMRPTSIYIPGPQSLEKSAMLRELLSLRSVRVAYVRGSETYWSRNLFFERTLMQIKMSVAVAKSYNPHPNFNSPIIALPEQRNGFLNTETCGSTALFIEKLKAHFLGLKSTQASLETAYILIEDFDKLDSKVFGENFAALLLRLEELTSIPLGVIMTGSCDWNDLHPEFAVQAPLILHLRAPTTNEMISMLKECDIALPKTLADRVLAAQTLPQATMIGVEESGDHVNDVLPSLDTRRLFQNFVPVAVHSLRLAYPTKPELLYIITQLFPRYLEPVLSAIEKGSDPPVATALYATISPYFAIAMNCPSIMLLGEALDKQDGEHTSSNQHALSSAEFPLICKYLVLSAWIAARNPTIDIEIKNRKRRRKTNISLAARLEEDMFDPPSAWRLDKLLSILDHLLAGNEEAEDMDDVETAEDAEILKRLQAQVLEAQSELRAEEAIVEEESSSQLWANVEFNDSATTGLASDLPSSRASQTSQQSSQQFDGISVGLTSEDELPPESVLAKAFESASLFPLLWESHAGHTHQLEILTQIGVLEQIGLFIRSGALTSNTSRSRAEYRCGFDASFANLVADSINFPLWGFM